MSLRPRFLAQATRYVYKTVFNLVDTDSNKFFSVIGNNSGTRGHAYKLHTGRVKKVSRCTVVHISKARQ